MTLLIMPATSFLQMAAESMRQPGQKKKKKGGIRTKTKVGLCVLKVKEKGHDPWTAGSCYMLKEARSLLKEDSSANTLVLVL